MSSERTRNYEMQQAIKALSVKIMGLYKKLQRYMVYVGQLWEIE